MCHQHKRSRKLFVEIENKLDDFRTCGGVEIAGGLVGEEYFCLGREGTRNRYALLLAARKLIRVVRNPLGKANALEQRGCFGACLCIALELDRQHDILERGETRQ